MSLDDWRRGKIEELCRENKCSAYINRTLSESCWVRRCNGHVVSTVTRPLPQYCSDCGKEFERELMPCPTCRGVGDVDYYEPILAEGEQ